MTVEYCNGGDSGAEVGQVASITLASSLATYGESLNYGQIGQSLSASAQDCKGNSVSVRSFTYASTNLAVADINPSTGQVCAGTWNRFTGGGVADYTTCTTYATSPPTYIAYVTATAEGASSNAVPVFVHPVASNITIGNPTPTASCSTTNDPSTNCCPLSYTAPTAVDPYDPTVCLSQGTTRQLTARVYSGTATPANNITCQVGHLTFSTQGASNIATIDENGVITANQPGSATITATISNSGSGSTAGFYSTCPPASIELTTAAGSTGPVSVALNNSQSFTALVKDTNGTTLTGLSLEYNSTTQQTIPTSGSSVTPSFPGSATITAVCNPSSCNTAPYSQIGYLGNGTALTSNGVVVNATGTSSTVLYIGSTSSQYLYPVDFTTSNPSALVKLPYVPNSMVTNQAGTEIYLGSSSALMTVSATTGAVTSTNTSVVGPVLAVSPDGGTLVVTNPDKKTISLISSTGSTVATNNGVATAAQFSPDGNTVYIIGTDQSGVPQLLVHNSFTSWTAIGASYTDIAVTVPHIGVFFASSITDARSYCPKSTSSASTTNGTAPVVANSFYPVAEQLAIPTDRLAATTDGAHILGATATTTPATLNDINASTLPTQTACSSAPLLGNNTPTTFTDSQTAHPLTGITATSITGVVPATNSALAFVTYNGTSAAAGQLPAYVPSTGAVSFVKLSGAATAPVAGIFSSDNLNFFVGTAGDNQVHQVAITYNTAGTAPATVSDIAVLTPNLPDSNGGIATPNLLVQRPKKTTN